MKNSFHSNNFICLINATSQALTISNAPPQLPVSITFPAVPKGASKKLYPSDFLGSSDRKCLPDNRGIYRSGKSGTCNTTPKKS